MIVSKPKMDKIVIDLTGPQGNAFFLMGTATNLSKQLGLDATKIVGEMIAGDYENVVKTFDKHFGDLVILYR